MDWKIPLFKMYSDQDDIEEVKKVLVRATFWAGGPEIDHFEKEIKDYMGTKFCLTFNSGTSALHSLLLAYGVEKKEVIVPSFTFISTVNTVILAGGIPIFAEVESDTFGLDANDVKKKITTKTAAIVIVHYGGFPARDTLAIKELADKVHIPLFEDTAESMGASINGKKVGTIGTIGMLSFCQNKIITTGEGGAVITESKELYEKMKLIRSHGRFERGEDYFSSIGDMDYVLLGYNFRISAITAALGIAQMKKINKLIEMRRQIAAKMDNVLKSIPQITLPTKIPGHFQVFQMYAMLVKNETLRDALQKQLASKGIMTKVYFNPVHLKTFYKKGYGYKEGDLPYTEELSKRELNLPFYPGISDKDLDYILSLVKKFFE